MYSEITITCKNALPINLSETLEKQFGKSFDKKESLDNTVLKGLYHILNRIEYAYNNYDKVYIIQSPDIRSIKIHVESNVQKNDIRVLRESIEEVVTLVERFLKENKNKISSAKAIINAEDSYLQTGRLVSRSKIFIDTLKSNIFLDLTIPSTTFIISWLTGNDLKDSGINVLAVIAASLISLLAKVLIFEKNIIYREE